MKNALLSSPNPRTESDRYLSQASRLKMARVGFDADYDTCWPSSDGKRHVDRSADRGTERATQQVRGRRRAVADPKLTQRPLER